VLPLEIPPGTTVESLLTEVLPALHERLVSDSAPADPLAVVVRVEGRGGWTVHIRGRHMRVEEGEVPRPTLWVHTTGLAVQRLLDDALGPRRFLPDVDATLARVPDGGVLLLSDPRLVKRVAMVSGRVELVLTDDDGARLSVVLGLGDAARRPIDPERPQCVAEGARSVLERALRGELAPEEAITGGAVRVRGNRLLVLQLALAVAPFYPRRPS